MSEAVCSGHQIGLRIASNVGDISSEPAVSPVSGDLAVGEIVYGDDYQGRGRARLWRKTFASTSKNNRKKILE